MPLLLEKQALEIKSKLMRGFADPSRLSLLEALREGPLTVSALVAATGLSQPNASNHLACLRDCGLVTAEPRGRAVYYRLHDERVNRLLGLADELLADVAEQVYACTRYNRSGESS